MGIFDLGGLTSGPFNWGAVLDTGLAARGGYLAGQQQKQQEEYERQREMRMEQMQRERDAMAKSFQNWQMGSEDRRRAEAQRLKDQEDFQFKQRATYLAAQLGEEGDAILNSTMSWEDKVSQMESLMTVGRQKELADYNANLRDTDDEDQQARQAYAASLMIGRLATEAGGGVTWSTPEGRQTWKNWIDQANAAYPGADHPYPWEGEQQSGSRLQVLQELRQALLDGKITEAQVRAWAEEQAAQAPDQQTAQRILAEADRLILSARQVTQQDNRLQGLQMPTGPQPTSPTFDTIPQPGNFVPRF